MSYAQTKVAALAKIAREQANTPDAKENVEFAKSAVVEARRQNAQAREQLQTRSQNQGQTK